MAEFRLEPKYFYYTTEDTSVKGEKPWQNRVALAMKQNRIEQNREPRNRPKH